MSATYDECKSILGGQVTIFTLSGSANKTWQVRFKNPLGKKPRYVRKSLSTTDESIAIVRAQDLFNEYQTRKHLGLTKGAVTIGQLFDQYSYSMSKVMRSMATMYKDAYWDRYFGDRDASRMNTADMTAYFKWRVDDYINRDESDGGAGSWRASEESISFYTLKAERQVLHWLFQRGYDDNQIPRIPGFPRQFQQWENVHTLPSNNRRGRFTDIEYSILMKEFSSIAKALRKEEWAPVLINPEMPFDPDENPYVSIAKRDVEEGREQRSPIYTSTKRRYPKAFFWFASLFLAQTGVRASEMVKLKHSDIKLVTDDDGAVYTVVNIRSNVSKVRKQRLAIAADGSETYRRYLTYKKELQYYFNTVIGDDDYIFPQTEGPNRYIGRRENISNRFRPELKRLGLHTGIVETANGKKISVYYSAYSFRSWYITQRLANGLDVFTLSLNCGVSIQTLVRSYVKNTTWEFRDKMTVHLSRNRTLLTKDQVSPELKAHLRPWKG